MKALKYGMTLVLGLSLSVCGAQVFAQSSGQSQTVTPEHPNTLPEVPAAGSEQPAQQTVEKPQRGIPTPKYIEDMVSEGKFVEAEAEFNKFIKKAQGDPCNLLYLRMSFYARLMYDDTANAQAHQAKRDGYIADMEKTCPDMADLYMLKLMMNPNQNPETIIQWMDKVIEIDPSYGEAYGVRGDAYWRLGQTQKACVDFKKAKELDPNYVNNNYESQCAEYEK